MCFYGFLRTLAYGGCFITIIIIIFDIAPFPPIMFRSALESLDSCHGPYSQLNPGGGGGGVTEGGRPSLHISKKKGSFFMTACQRFCKRRVLFCTQVRSMGVKIPLQSTKYTRL